MATSSGTTEGTLPITQAERDEIQTAFSNALSDTFTDQYSVELVGEPSTGDEYDYVVAIVKKLDPKE